MNRRQIIRTTILVASVVSILIFVAVVAASCGRSTAEREGSKTADSGLTTPTSTPGRLSLGATGSETTQAYLETPTAIDSGETPVAEKICEVTYDGVVYQVAAGDAMSQPVVGGTLVISTSRDCSIISTSMVPSIPATPLPSAPTNVPTADPTPAPTTVPTEVPTQAPTVPPTPVPPVVIVVTATPTTPSLVVTPPSAPTGSGTCVNPGDLAVMVDAARRSTNLMPPYALIAALDAHPAKQDHPIAGWTSDEATVYWTGNYVSDTTYGKKVVEVLVDGKTGTYMQLPGTSVTWQTAGGSIAICDDPGLLDLLKQAFPGLFASSGTSATPASTPASTSTSAPTSVPPTAPTATGPVCVDTKQVIDLINSNKADPDRVFVHLDEIADQTPTARLRTEGPATYTVANTSALIWVKTDEISGATMPIHASDNKTLYLATADGQVSLTYAHSGLRLCTALDPARDFPWWGK